MSQITRCPQCQTRFKVVDDQLRISDGWVRCGKCKSVFDALTHLVARPAADAPESDKPATVKAPSPAPVAPPVAPVAAPVAAEPAKPPPPTTPVSAPVVASNTPSPASNPAGVVMVTENSLAVDPHANVPELSVLVFPRRAGFGDSGYVDSSWMSAYEADAAAPAPQAPPTSATQSANQSASTGRAANKAESPADAALESEWRGTADLRPEGLRSSVVGFSAQDDLAELQAREGRLLEAIAEKKAKSETKMVALDSAGVPASALSAKAVLQPAPAPKGDDDVGSALVDKDFEEKLPLAPDQQALVAPKKGAVEAASADGGLPKRVAEDALYAEPELAGRTVEPGKVEPALDGPYNYVAEIEAASPSSQAAIDADAADEPGFVRDAKRKAFWSKPSVVVLTLLCALALLAGLLFQVAVKQRDQLAVQYPQLRPALGQVCKLAGCQLAVPRDLQRITIDSTSFNPIGARQFKLTVVLRNAADYAVAVPALELSLNDAAEKLVLRRVLTAADMKAPAELPAHGEWTAVVPIQVAEPRHDVVGYRVLAFYP